MEQFKQNVCSYLSSVNNINKDGNPLLVNPQSQSDSDSQCFQNVRMSTFKLTRTLSLTLTLC